jgi:hypothetical protein
MTLAIRTVLIVALTLLFAAGMSGQSAESPAPPAETLVAPEVVGEPAEPSVATDETATLGGGARSKKSRYEIRAEFTRLLMEQPRELRLILGIDPTLLANEAFLTGHPDVAAYVATHPEIRRNPRFYLVEFLPDPRGQRHVLDEMVEMLAVTGGFLLAVLGFAWLVRTIIEQKRWNRLTRTQNEVHNKILDRFGSSEELLAYINTPAGAKFLESAPIPLHVERKTQNQPMARVVWSIQLGVIIAAGALGMLLVSLRLDEEPAQALFTLGGIALCIGIGFIASAAASIFLSQRLGIWSAPVNPPAEPLDDSGLVR